MLLYSLKFVGSNGLKMGSDIVLVFPGLIVRDIILDLLFTGEIECHQVYNLR